MTYRLLTTPTARRQIERDLPESVAAAALEFVNGPLLVDPRRVGKPLFAPREGQYGARRGEYRIIYTIDDAAGMVTVLSIRHRRDAYRS